MIPSLLHQLVPPSVYGGTILYPELSALDRALPACPGTGETLEVLEGAKPRLNELLRARFGEPAGQALTLKILNLILARHHFQARSSSVESRPFGLVIDPSNMCQLACPGCVHSTRSEQLGVFDWKNGTLSEDRLSALLRRYGPYCVGVYFCNYGEPLLNLNTPRLIRLAKSYLMGTMLSTSLSVKRFDAEAYVESGLDFMVLSIDGVTQAVYERFRRNGDLELVLTNVRQLVAAKRRLRRRTPVLSWNFLAFEHNAHEIPHAARMARKLGVDVFRVVDPFDVRWDDPDVRPAAVKPGVRRLSWHSSSNLHENWNPFPDSLDAATILREFERPWSGASGKTSTPGAGHTCHWLYQNMTMDATGRILPCCGAPRPDVDLVFAQFDGNGADPFNSEKYRQARSWFAGTAVSESAPHCARCEWDHDTVNIGGAAIRRYFRAADPGFFDRRSLRFLSEW